MKNFWSTYIQTSEELFTSRRLRFRKDNAGLWLSAMKLRENMDVLEVGAGSGPFCLRIKELLPTTKVTGLDMDEGHIKFARKAAREHSLDCNFVIGDALNLPFDAGTFDAVTSHTVIEHVETKKFLSEQLRVLKPGGICSVLSVRTGLSVYPESWKNNEDNEENQLTKKAWATAENFDKNHGVAAYGLNENEIPKAMETAGFTNVAVDFIHCVHYCPDSSNFDETSATAQIEMNRTFALHSIKKALAISPESLTETEQKRLSELINIRFDKRINDYKAGIKHWDMAVSSIMATTGTRGTMRQLCDN